MIALVRRMAVLAIVTVVRFYQMAISPWLGPRCRFDPTCSEYAIQAVGRYGPIKGLWKTTGRILRCHPWSEGGHDPP